MNNKEISKELIEKIHALPSSVLMENVSYYTRIDNMYYIWKISAKSDILSLREQEFYDYASNFYAFGFDNAPMDLLRSLLTQKGQQIILDESIFLSILQPQADVRPDRALFILEAIEKGDLNAVMPVLCLFNILSSIEPSKREHVFFYITKFRNLSLLPADTEVVGLSNQYPDSRNPLITATIAAYCQQQSQSCAYVHFGESYAPPDKQIRVFPFQKRSDEHGIAVPGKP